jgi:hypothetical protein
MKVCPSRVGLHVGEVDISTARAHFNAHAKIRVATAYLKFESLQLNKRDVLDDEAKLTGSSDLLVINRQVSSIKSGTELQRVRGRGGQAHANFIKLGGES